MLSNTPITSSNPSKQVTGRQTDASSQVQISLNRKKTNNFGLTELFPGGSQLTVSLQTFLLSSSDTTRWRYVCKSSRALTWCSGRVRMLIARQAAFAFARISWAQKLWSAGISIVQTFGIPYFTFEEWYQMGLGSVQLSFPKRIWPSVLYSGLKYPCNPVIPLFTLPLDTSANDWCRESPILTGKKLVAVSVLCCTFLYDLACLLGSTAKFEHI